MTALGLKVNLPFWKKRKDRPCFPGGEPEEGFHICGKCECLQECLMQDDLEAMGDVLRKQEA